MTDDTPRTFTLTLPRPTGDRVEVEISTGQLLDARPQRENATPPIKEAA